MGEPTQRFQTFAEGDVILPDFLNDWLQDYIIALRADMDAVAPDRAVVSLQRVSSPYALSLLDKMVDGEIAVVDGQGVFQYREEASDTADDVFVVQPATGAGRWVMLGRRPAWVTRWAAITEIDMIPDAELAANGYWDVSDGHGRLIPADDSWYHVRARVPGPQPGDHLVEFRLSVDIGTSGGMIIASLRSRKPFQTATTSTDTEIVSISMSTTGAHNLAQTIDYSLTTNNPGLGEYVYVDIALRNGGVASNCKVYFAGVQFERQWVR